VLRRPCLALSSARKTHSSRDETRLRLPPHPSRIRAVRRESRFLQQPHGVRPGARARTNVRAVRPGEGWAAVLSWRMKGRGAVNEARAHKRPRELRSRVVLSSAEGTGAERGAQWVRASSAGRGLSVVGGPGFESGDQKGTARHRDHIERYPSPSSRVATVKANGLQPPTMHVSRAVATLRDDPVPARRLTSSSRPPPTPTWSRWSPTSKPPARPSTAISSSTTCWRRSGTRTSRPSVTSGRRRGPDRRRHRDPSRRSRGGLRAGRRAVTGDHRRHGGRETGASRAMPPKVTYQRRVRCDHGTIERRRTGRLRNRTVAVRRTRATSASTRESPTPSATSATCNSTCSFPSGTTRRWSSTSTAAPG